MDNKYYESVIKEMQPFFDEHNFKANEDGSFSNDKKAAKVDYNENKQMYILSVADVTDGQVGSFNEINQWLFDDSQNAKDAESVGMDFTVSLRKELGIKNKRTITDGSAVDLPTASKDGNMNIDGLTKKMLDVFPVLKEEYKAHVAQYNKFLYLSFYGHNVVPQLKNYLANATTKQKKKLFDVLDDAYVSADRDTVNTIIATLCAASYNDSKINDAVKQLLANDKHFLSCYEAYVPVFAKNKKLLSIMVK